MTARITLASFPRPCTKCGVTKPAHEFPWASRRREKKQAQCLSCVRPYWKLAAARLSATKAAKSAERIARRLAATEKRCTKCKAVKPISDFPPRKESSDRRTSQCVECRRQNCDSWNRRNRERQREAAKANYRANIERRREYNRQYRDKNADYYVRYNAEWGRANLDKGRARRTKRRAALLQAMPEWVDQGSLLAVYAEAVERRLDVDHIVPLQSKSRLRSSCSVESATPNESGEHGKTEPALARHAVIFWP